MARLTLLARSGVASTVRAAFSLSCPSSSSTTSKTASSADATPMTAPSFTLSATPIVSVRRPFSTTPVASAHRPSFYVRRPKKNMSHAVGKSKKPRISFMTKGVEEEEREEFRKLLEDMEGEGRGGGGGEEEKEMTEGGVVKVEGETLDNSLAVYRDRMVTRIVSMTEDALYASDPSTTVWTAETREKLNYSVEFLLKDGGVFAPDLIRFLTTGPTNPRRFCLLPEDRLVEVATRLVDVGLRDKALLSVMWHDNLKVFSNPVSRIHESLEFLREEGVALSETLSTILIDCPALLADLDQEDWRRRKDWFDHNFTTRSFREFLITQPAVLHEPMEDIEEKFYYVYTEMGLDQKQMMECRIFMHKLDYIKCRHEFLRRCGFYKFPDPRKRVVNLNAHLHKILDWKDARFVTLVPGFELKDYHVFKRIFFQERDDELEDDEYDPEEEAREAVIAELKLQKGKNRQPVPGCFMAVGKRKGHQRYYGASD